MEQVVFKGILAATACSIVNSRCFLIQSICVHVFTCKMTFVRLLVELNNVHRTVPGTQSQDTDCQGYQFSLFITCCGVASGGSMDYIVCLHLRHVSMRVSFFLYRKADFVEGKSQNKGYVIQWWAGALWSCQAEVCSKTFLCLRHMSFIGGGMGWGSSLKTNPFLSQHCIFDDILEPQKYNKLRLGSCLKYRSPNV